ncbi:MAG: hypothetical protein ABIN89_26190 [Chitinophagaceae bacterium]
MVQYVDLLSPLNNVNRAAWKGIIGKSFTADSFDSYCHTVTWSTWRRSFIVLHNTAIPSLVMRQNGFSQDQINRLQSYYSDDQNWRPVHIFLFLTYLRVI